MSDKNRPIYVSRPSLAPLEEYSKYLKVIWETGIMTHNGPMVQSLERELCDYLNVKNLVCLANGTAALQLAIRALNLTGEVITTPFTYIATASIIAWERCRPIFVDIDPDTWNIDPEKIEEKITDKTTAILPVHVFSNPCDIERIQKIAAKHTLKVIYDAAHAMAVEVDGQSILRFGDISCLSFHATKLFNTAEGGACITDDSVLAEKMRRARFFGFNEKKEIVDEGMNAKMTEVSAGLGHANLKSLDRVRKNRRVKYELYQNLLADIPSIKFQKYLPDSYNYSYMPIIFESEELLLRIIEKLHAENVFPRRYFYPSLNTVSVFAPQDALPISERVAKTIICLPLYDSLPPKDIERVCHCIAQER